MMDAVRASLEERDLLLFVIDATRPFTEEDERAVSVLRRTDRRLFSLQQNRHAESET